MASKKEILARKQRRVLRMLGCKVRQENYRGATAWYWLPLDETLVERLPGPESQAFSQRMMAFCREWGMTRGLELAVYVMSHEGIHVDVYLEESHVGRVATADTPGEAMVLALYEAFSAAGLLKGRK